MYSIPWMLIWLPKRFTNTLSVLYVCLFLIFIQKIRLFHVSLQEIYINRCFLPFPWINIVCSLKIISSSDMLEASSILMPVLISKSINARSRHAFQKEKVDISLFVLSDRWVMSFVVSSMDKVLGNLRSFLILKL